MDPLLDTLFGTASDISWMQECARALVVFSYGLALVRLGGRRIFAQWTPIDIVVAIVMGSSLSRALTGSAHLFATLAAMTVLVALHRAVSHACASWPSLSRWIEGAAIRLGGDGDLSRRKMSQHGVSPAGLDEALRQAGLESAAGARLIVLEPSGRISVLKGAQPQSGEAVRHDGTGCGPAGPA